MRGLPILLNRDFKLPADNWYHSVPIGEYPHAASNTVQVVDSRAVASMVAKFKEEAAGKNFPGLLVDYDHFSHHADQPSEAAGWIEDLEARPDGVWSKIRWSDNGLASVTGGRYRLASPTWLNADCEELGNGKLRPLRLENLALTNEPNMRGMVPLSNRESSDDPTAKDATTKPNTMNYKDELCRVLGLSPEASDADITAATGTMKNACMEAEKLKATNSAVTNRLTKLEAENKALLAAQVENDLKEFSAVVKDPAAVKEQLLANREETLKLLRNIKIEQPPKKPLHNRESAAHKPSPTEEQDTEAVLDAAKLSNRAREIASTQRLPFAQAWAMARQEFDGAKLVTA